MNDKTEQILKKEGYSVICWSPLEILDKFGYVIMRTSAQNILDRLLKEHEMENEKEMEPPHADQELEDVRRFHQKFGFIDSGRIPVMVSKRKLTERLECMQEELDEFKKAIETQDFAEQADALIDLVYFAKGTAVMMGLPWEHLWDDVQRANLTKERGVTKRGHAFDVVKPEGWQKPQGEKILAEAGYNRGWYEVSGDVCEELCVDDHQRVKFADVGQPTMIRYFTDADGKIVLNPAAYVVEGTN